MNSRTILTIVIALLVVVICVGLYFLLFAGKATPATTTVTGQTGSLPASGVVNQNPSNPGTTTSSTTTASLTKSFGVILNQPVLDYFVSASNTVTAVETNGNIAQVINGQATIISSTTLQNILSASFSYDGEKVFVSLGTAANPETSVFDVGTKIWTALPMGVQSPAWSPSDYRLAYLTASVQGTETLATIDESKASPKPAALTTLYAQDLAVAWPTQNQIVLYTKPSAYVAGSAWIYNPQKTTLTTIADEVPGLQVLWNGQGATGSQPASLEFAGGEANLGGSLSLADVSGNTLQQLKFATLPSKCLFATASTTPYLFCGVPRDQNTFSISHLPDDYDQMALFTSDDIYRINLESGAIQPIFNDQTQNLDVSDVKFFNNMLFFINRYDQKLYAIGLITM